MKTVLRVLLGVVFIVLFALLPEIPSTAYPPQTPLPPVTVEPTIYVPSSDAPRWMHVECGSLFYAQIGWYDPPSYLLPFNSVASGYLYLDYGETYEMHPLRYDGYNLGWYYWHVYAFMPPQNFRISAFVRDVDNNGHWVDPFFIYMNCYDNVYLPYIVR